MLFEDAAMTVNYGERVALVGPNGAGKSTLFSIILKQTEPDAGTVERDAWTMLGYPAAGSAKRWATRRCSTWPPAARGNCPRWKNGSPNSKPAGVVDSPEYLEAHAKHEALSDPQVDAKAKKMLAGLGYRESDFERPARN